MTGASLRDRIEAVKDRADIVGVVGRAIALGRGRKPRGKCPFHGSNSDSFAVDPDRGSARCWGCGWSGDAIKFVADFHGLGFLEALEHLESDHGLDGLAAAPRIREKQARILPDRPAVDSRTMGRFILRTSRADPAAVRTYLRARGVPESVLVDHRLDDLRFHPAAPISAWPVVIGKAGPVDYRAPPRGWPNAPAMVALVRRPPKDPRAGGEWRLIGLHVTYLSPGLNGKMVRRRRDGELHAARKMLGCSAGGCVLLGRYRADCRLFPGEGIETVLSGMAIAGAGDQDVGLATLSLDNLEGFPRHWKSGVLPLHAIEPDPDRPPALAFRHDGPVTGLIDADMAPLRGPLDRAGGGRQGLPIQDRRGGPIVRRAITTAERAAICGELFVKSWRSAGTRRVSAVRPRMGRDFNDVAREREAAE